MTSDWGPHDRERPDASVAEPIRGPHVAPGLRILVNAPGTARRHPPLAPLVTPVRIEPNSLSVPKPSERMPTDPSSWLTRMFVRMDAAIRSARSKSLLGVRAGPGRASASRPIFASDSAERATDAEVSLRQAPAACNTVESLLSTPKIQWSTPWKSDRTSAVVGPAQVVAFRELSVSIVDRDGQQAVAELLPVGAGEVGRNDRLGSRQHLPKLVFVLEDNRPRRRASRRKDSFRPVGASCCRRPGNRCDHLP